MLPSLPSSLTGCRDRLNSSAALFMAVPASQYPPALHKTLSEANRQVPLLPTATLPALGLHKRSVCCSARVGKPGLRNARVKGKRLGRPPKDLDAVKIAKLRDQGLAWRAIAAELGVGLATLHRAAGGRSKIQERDFGTR
jgi:hypothetical protein